MLLIHGHRNKRISNIKKVRIKRGTTINVVASAQIGKNIVGVKKIMFRILLHAVAKMVKMEAVLLTIQRSRLMKLWKKKNCCSKKYFMKNDSNKMYFN